jgi:class 3 adenylate cyclase
MKPKDKDRIFRSLAGFVPEKILLSKTAGIQKIKPYEIFDAALLFADISGFTAMSERLAILGKEGAEEVNKIINAFFESLINIVYQHQGDIYRFGGDAFLAFFPESAGGLPASVRAIRAAVEILKFVKRHEITKTKVGKFKIKIHIGINKGKVFFKDLTHDFFLAGAVVNDLMKLIDQAEPGEIVVDKLAMTDLKNCVFKIKNGVGKYLGMKPGLPRRPAAKPEPDKKPIPTGESAFNALQGYIPEWLSRRVELKPYFDHKDGEHRKIAVVFLHFRGVPYDRNPVQASRRIDKFYQIVRQTIGKYDGWLNALDVYKDSERVLAVFGFPKAYEDDVKRAALFAYEILHHPDLKNMAFRAGINTGSIFAAPVGSELRREYATLGDAVNLAARLGAKAEPGTIVVSEAVFNKTYALFNYESLGEKEYKGKKARITSFRLAQKKQVEKKVLAKWLSESEKMVGRNKEVKELENRIAAVKNSKGRILAINGEPGIGKSRLTQELIRRAGNAGFQIYKGDCISYGGAFTYHPWVEIMTDIFGILTADTQKERAAKIRNKTRAVDEKLTDWLPIIGDLMGVPFPENALTKFLDPKIKKQRVFDIIFDFARHEARKKPLVLIIEDLHWADTASLELVNYIGRNIGDKPILLTLVHRPLKKKEEFMEKDFYSAIALKELTREDSLELVKNLLNIKDTPGDLSNLIVEKSQGNPFYLEELAKSLIEQEYIVEEKGGWKFVGDIKKLQLPDSVEAVILSRIDRLELQERDILQVASVLGREFDGLLLSGIYPEAPALKKTLRNLERLDLIKEEKTENQLRYIFKHIMTREVAYGTLSFARKTDLHRQTGQFIETKFKARQDEFLGLLSYHFFAGGDYDKSLYYSVLAGEKAKKVYANEEAIEFFTRGIESYERLNKKQ